MFILIVVNAIQEDGNQILHLIHLAKTRLGINMKDYCRWAKEVTIERFICWNAIQRLKGFVEHPTTIPDVTLLERLKKEVHQEEPDLMLEEIATCLELSFEQVCSNESFSFFKLCVYCLCDCIIA